MQASLIKLILAQPILITGEDHFKHIKPYVNPYNRRELRFGFCGFNDPTVTQEKVKGKM